MIRGLILQTRNELVSHGFGNFAKPVEAMGDREFGVDQKGVSIWL